MMTRPPPNFDLSLLSIDILTGPYIYADGSEPEDTDVFAEDEGWTTVADAITRIEIVNGTDFDTLNQAPKPGTANLAFTLARDTAFNYFTSLYGRWFRVKYGSTTLFTGQAVETNATVGVDPDNPGDANQYAIECALRGAVRDLAQIQLGARFSSGDTSTTVGFTAPAETVADRIARLANDYGVTITTSGLDAYLMAGTVEPQEGSLLSKLNECVLAGHARFYLTPTNGIVITGTPAAVTVAFDIAAEGAFDFDPGIAWGTSDEYLLSETRARLKKDESMAFTQRNGSAVQKRAQEFIVDLVGPDTLEAWSLTVKHQSKSPFFPQTLTTKASASIPWATVVPTSLATVKLPHRTATVTVGISSIKHTITPWQWSTEFGFVPRYFAEFDALEDVT